MAATVPLNTAWLLRQLLLVVLFSVTSAINALAITSADNNAMPTSLDIDNAGPMSMLIDMQLERFRLRDICNAQTNRNLRLYMDYGDTGFVRGIARDRRVERPPNGAEVDGSRSSKHSTLHRKECTVELVTCPSCRIRLTRSTVNIAQRNCEPSNVVDDEGGLPSEERRTAIGYCKCNYISFFEPPFGLDQNGHERRICAEQQSADHISHSRSLRIHFSMTHIGRDDAFNFTIVAERNLDELYGVPIDSRLQTAQKRRPSAIIMTPFFPASVPSDFIKQHLIRCSTTTTPTTTVRPLAFFANPTTAVTSDTTTTAAHYSACSIRILFTDFQIDAMSRVEFFNSDGDLIEMLTGQMFRPAVLLSDGPSILMRFYANGGTAPMRYRAEVEFLAGVVDELLQPDASRVYINGNAVDAGPTDDVLRPRTECGGTVDTLGGAITMMDMVANATQRRRYDCIWLVRPSERYANARPYLSLRVHTFEEFVEHSELTIHEGLTSVGQLVGSLQSHRNDDAAASSKEYVVPATTGFYVRFQGTFAAAAKLSLVYTVFGYDSKSTALQFDCRNNRLIPLQLQCDGFDHCGDNSDEPDSCMLVWKHETYDRRWYSHTPNYYFPKTAQYPDMRSATIVFLVSTGALVFLISGIVLLLYRMANWARDYHPNGSGGNSNNSSSHDLGDSNHIMIVEELDENSIDDQHPPKYEAPPTYDEVIRVGMEEYCAAKVMALRDCLKNAVIGATGMVGVGGNSAGVVAREMPDVGTDIVEETVTISNIIDGQNMAVDTVTAECNLMTLATIDNNSSTSPCHVTGSCNTDEIIDNATTPLDVTATPAATASVSSCTADEHVNDASDSGL